jgi:peptide deformylase
MQIITDPNDAILHTLCRQDFVVSAHELSEMFRLMKAANGAGLAAPQVGLPYRLFITIWGDVFINPKIVNASLTFRPSVEGCLSLPGVERAVKRHEWVQLNCGSRYEGFQATVVQHELDHLNGKLITDLPVWEAVHG